MSRTYLSVPSRQMEKLDGLIQSNWLLNRGFAGQAWVRVMATTDMIEAQRAQVEFVAVVTREKAPGHRYSSSWMSQPSELTVLIPFRKGDSTMLESFEEARDRLVSGRLTDSMVREYVVDRGGVLTLETTTMPGG